MAHVDLKISGRPCRVEFELPDGEVSSAGDLLPVFQQFSDAVVGAAVTAAAEPVSCAKGCAACCRQLIPIRAMEARRLAACVRTLPEPQRSTLLARFDSAARRVAESGLRARLESREELDQAGRIALKLDYFALGIACPFLEGESCGIYAERPLICREHLVTTPAAWCADPRAHGVRTLAVHHADTAVAKIEAGPGVPGWIPLIDLLDWAERHPEEEDLPPRLDPRGIVQQFLQNLAG